MAAFLCDVIFEAKEVGEISKEYKFLRQQGEKSMHFLLKKTQYIYAKIYAYGPDLEENI